ncbi:MAG: RNA polymerase sigma factor [Planctomycetota bacterium]
MISAAAITGMACPESAADREVAQLTAAIARGDRAAFATFYEAWFERALRRLRSLCGADEHAAFDLVHDVMLKVAEKMPPLPDQRALDAWMAKAMLSTALDRRRTELRRTRRESTAARPEVEEGPGLLDELCAGEQMHWVRLELSRLSDADRSMLEARYFGEASHARIAQGLGKTADAVSSRIRRVLASIAKRARGWFDHD